MKTLRAIVSIALVAGAACAVDLTITNFISGYKLVPSTTADAGDTGLATGTAYAAIPMSFMTTITTGDVPHTASGDYRQLLYAFMKACYVKYESIASTNRSDYSVLTEDIGHAGGTNYYMTHKLRSRIYGTDASFESE